MYAVSSEQEGGHVVDGLFSIQEYGKYRDHGLECLDRRDARLYADGSMLSGK